MLKIPAIANKVLARPGSNDFESPHFIPDYEEHQEFWDMVYEKLRDINFQSPIPKPLEESIDSNIGYYGLRSHPIDPSRPYYHIGVEMRLGEHLDVYPVSSGILEYSGYGATHGYYVLLSHPEVQTEDGYILHSMYCHLKKPLVSFNSYQKMLREISLGSYPLIDIPQEKKLAVVGMSGVVEEKQPTLYLQLDFRKFDEKPITIDPLPIFTGTRKANNSAKNIHSF